MYICMCGIQYGGLETGSSINFAPIIGRYVISSANTIFSRVANTMELQVTLKTSCISVESNMAARKPEIVITLLVF